MKNTNASDKEKCTKEITRIVKKCKVLICFLFIYYYRLIYSNGEEFSLYILKYYYQIFKNQFSDSNIIIIISKMRIMLKLLSEINKVNRTVTKILNDNKIYSRKLHKKE